MPVLSASEIQSSLKDLSGWSLQGKALVREFQFPAFTDAVVFVNRIAEAAEEANHHPDIDIRYNRVTLALTSHDSGGVTKRDVRLAKTISGLADAAAAKI